MATRRTFETTAVGFAIVTLLLVFGMAFSIHRLAANANAQIARVRSEEDEITQVERVRWTAELIVSSGRGYLTLPNIGHGDRGLKPRTDRGWALVSERTSDGRRQQEEATNVHGRGAHGDPEGRRAAWGRGISGEQGQRIAAELLTILSKTKEEG